MWLWCLPLISLHNVSSFSRTKGRHCQYTVKYYFKCNCWYWMSVTWMFFPLSCSPGSSFPFYRLLKFFTSSHYHHSQPHVCLIPKGWRPFWFRSCFKWCIDDVVEMNEREMKRLENIFDVIIIFSHLKKEELKKQNNRKNGKVHQKNSKHVS